MERGMSMKILNKFFIIFTLLFLFTINYNVSASVTTKLLDFSLEKVVELGDYKILSIKVINNSTSDYSFGWDGSCELVITTTEETVTKDISSGKILSGSDKTYDYTIKYKGEIKNITYNDIRKLDSRGYPISLGINKYQSYDISVDIASYDLFFGKTILAFCCIALVVLIILILILKKKKGGRMARKIGGIINVGAICILIYAGYCFVVKPDMESADFMDVAKKYWYLWILGIVLLGIGNSLRSKKGTTKRNRIIYYNDNNNKLNRNSYYKDNNKLNRNGYYNDNNQQYRVQQQNIDEQNRIQQQMFNEQNRIQQQMHEEQTRLFNEQVQRDFQQQQQTFDDQVQQDFQQQQQTFDDFNNFNNFNNGMF